MRLWSLSRAARSCQVRRLRHVTFESRRGGSSSNSSSERRGGCARCGCAVGPRRRCDADADAERRKSSPSPSALACGRRVMAMWLLLDVGRAAAARLVPPALRPVRNHPHGSVRGRRGESLRGGAQRPRHAHGAADEPPDASWPASTTATARTACVSRRRRRASGSTRRRAARRRSTAAAANSTL